LVSIFAEELDGTARGGTVDLDFNRTGNIGGRMRSILIDPTTPTTTTVWLGAVGGGVWKTTNCCTDMTTWSTTTDFLANLAVDCMAMDPTNSKVLYAGTGETWYPHDGIQGDGVFKTTDGGSTWTQLSATADNPDFYYVTRLAVAVYLPLRGTTVLLATTTTGLFRSLDGGTRWSRVMTGWYNTVIFQDPNNGADCLASRDGGAVFHSTDFGVTWAQSTLTGNYPTLAGRTELAYARSNPIIVYASACTAPPPYPYPTVGGALFKSTNGGLSFTYTGLGGFLGYDASYMNTLWVDPIDPTANTLVVGGQALYRSTDGGNTKSAIDQDSHPAPNAHADHHLVVNDPHYDGSGNRTVYIGTDGGIFKTDNILAVPATTVTWTSLNHTLGITQFYGGAATSDGSTIIGGTQDNATLIYHGDRENWTSISCSDGGMCAEGGGYFYGEIPTLFVFRSAEPSPSPTCPPQYITSQLGDTNSHCDYCGNWAAPLVFDPFDPNHPNKLLAGGLRLWRCTNPTDATPTWTAINAGPNCDCNVSSNDKISAITVAPGDSDIIWVGYNSGELYYTTNGTATLPTWTRIRQSPVPLPLRYCGSIAFGPRPAEYSRVYVAFGGYAAGNLWKTTDSGQTWTNISGGLPSAPITSIVTRWNGGYYLYVATAVGVFASADDGLHWSSGIAGDAPANVFVDELFWTKNGSRLVAVTHGRGMFTADVQ
jgi:photosystem II stability/assembly factor-like uncharacterized protein